ncbi:MAG TPA: SUMF1/EgtB/PvdO family nonheme iron enzyme [Flavobacteriales bacterium]|nr:SUMF1/EgtB/PvdO family nonheme iron enzyme [Flavobacteriales bacterium]
MKLKNLLFILLVLHGFFAKSQDVLDGVYVKYHSERTLFPVYPITLGYTFKDDVYFKDILSKKITTNNVIYPSFKELDMVDYTIGLAKNVINEDSTTAKKIRSLRLEERKKAIKDPKYKYQDPTERTRYKKKMENCHDFFERLLPQRPFISENMYPGFLKFHLQKPQVIDTGHIKSISAEVTPFLADFLTPFYIKKTEVTNAEYREFVQWVRDSIARTLLMRAAQSPEDWAIITTAENGQQVIRINWKARLRWNDDALRPILASLYLPENQRYYRRKEIDTRKLIYDYGLVNDSTDLVAVYPDTLAWVHGFNGLTHQEDYINDNPQTNGWDSPYDYYSTYDNNPKANMYFWHPAYDQFPVIGLTIQQVQAYLHWKTKMHNLENHRKKLNYTVSYELPNEMHWELAACQFQLGKRPDFGKYLTGMADFSYTYNLHLNSNPALIILKEEETSPGNTKKIRGYIEPNYAAAINMQSNQVFDLWTINTYREKNYNRGKYSEPNEICGLYNNVSEWTSSTIDSGYQKLLNLRWEILESYKSRELYLLAQTEKMHYEQTTSGTQLVRGGNWFDERTSEIEGINAKCFADPKKAYATVGFRYVMKISFFE